MTLKKKVIWKFYVEITTAVVLLITTQFSKLWVEPIIFHIDFLYFINVLLLWRCFKFAFCAVNNEKHFEAISVSPYNLRFRSHYCSTRTMVMFGNNNQSAQDNNDDRDALYRMNSHTFKDKSDLPWRKACSSRFWTLVKCAPLDSHSDWAFGNVKLCAPKQYL